MIHTARVRPRDRDHLLAKFGTRHIGDGGCPLRVVGLGQFRTLVSALDHLLPLRDVSATAARNKRIREEHAGTDG